jgi:hypothetical protein
MNFRAIGAIVIGVLAIGFGLYSGLSPSDQVLCGTEVMQPGDLCDTTRRGITSTYTYDEMKENASQTPWIALGAGILILAYGIFLVLRARRRAAAAAATPAPAA